VIPGNSAQDANPACRSEPDDASRSGATAGYDSADYGSADYGSADYGSADYDTGKPARAPRTYRILQDIQDIIDKLADVTQQLHRPGSPGSSVPGPLG
jgi:hypothetical protein